jgi:hypothetical protein
MNTAELVISRMQRLAALGLEGQPATEVLDATGRVWVQHLARFSPARLRMAFDAIETNATRWPTPGAIIAALPAYEHTYTPPVPHARRIAPDPEQVLRSQKRIGAEIAKIAAVLRTTPNEGEGDAD